MLPIRSGTKNCKPLVYLSFLMMSALSHADYRDDVGYTRLQAEIGQSRLTGAGVNVAQVEAAIGVTETNPGTWLPDTRGADFEFKTIIDQSLPPSNGYSDHALGVASVFYGNRLSMASGIHTIDSFSALDWMLSFLQANTNKTPKFSSSRISNHSWIGGSNPIDASNQVTVANVLRRIDWLVEADEAIQVVGMGNNFTNRPLLANAFNVISVGRTDGMHGQGSIAVDEVYDGSRSNPDIVAPASTTSGATPIVSAAAALLVEQAHGQGNAVSAASVINRAGAAIYNGERSEVVKAVMMAGADRVTKNTHSAAQITDYREAVENKTANGLDSRFGAGQLNVYNNFQIMAAGEQDSLQDAGNSLVALSGFDYDDHFGGLSGANKVASYRFSTLDQASDFQFTAALVWNMEIQDGLGAGFDPQANIDNFDLGLYDITNESSKVMLDSSTSPVDNSENIWTYLSTDRLYELQVVVGDGAEFDRDYAIAWQLKAVPAPAAIWLFISGMGVLLLRGVRI